MRREDGSREKKIRRLTFFLFFFFLVNRFFSHATVRVRACVRSFSPHLDMGMTLYNGDCLSQWSFLIGAKKGQDSFFFSEEEEIYACELLPFYGSTIHLPRSIHMQKKKTIVISTKAISPQFSSPFLWKEKKKKCSEWQIWALIQRATPSQSSWIFRNVLHGGNKKKETKRH